MAFASCAARTPSLIAASSVMSHARVRPSKTWSATGGASSRPALLHACRNASRAWSGVVPWSLIRWRYRVRTICTGLRGLQNPSNGLRVAIRQRARDLVSCTVQRLLHPGCFAELLVLAKGERANLPKSLREEVDEDWAQYRIHRSQA